MSQKVASVQRPLYIEVWAMNKPKVCRCCKHADDRSFFVGGFYVWVKALEAIERYRRQYAQLSISSFYDRFHRRWVAQVRLCHRGGPR